MPGGARIREGFETRLRQSGGCGDALLFARNSRDSMVLFVSAHQIAERAHEAGGPTTFSLDVASEEISLWLQRGRNLSHAACNDALSRQTRVSLEYQARSGHVSVTVTPTGTPTAQGEYPAEAILRIEDAVLTPAGDPNGEPVHLDGFELEARIGWLPG